MKTDKIQDWYKIAGKHSKSIKNDANFSKHMIKPCSQVMMIGGTGSGKSTALMEFLHRKQSFYRIILFTGSTTDEPLYNAIREHMDGIEFIDNVDELPELTDMNDEEKEYEKLIIFDDIINLKKKDLLKIQKWFNSSRKYGYTAICMVQNYTDAPIQIRRNCKYFILFKLNDNNTINQILKNHNTNGDDKEYVKSLYYYATETPKDFFTIDLTESGKGRYRHNFTDVL